MLVLALSSKHGFASHLIHLCIFIIFCVVVMCHIIFDNDIFFSRNEHTGANLTSGYRPNVFLRTIFIF